MAPITAAGWKGVHKDVDAPEGGGGGPREMFALVEVLLLCLYTDHVVQKSFAVSAVLDLWAPKAP